MQTEIIVAPSLSELIDEFTMVLRDPARTGAATTDAQLSVLAHVRAGYLNQDQIPITPDTSAERGAMVALRHAARQASILRVQLQGDLQPADDQRLAVTHDETGRLNPMGLFEAEGLTAGLYPFTALAHSLARAVPADQLQQAAADADAIAFVQVEEALDWETWMDTSLAD
ncbi:hypothetical protein [Zhihengliuella sp. ISTPL4]|uniref:hypothetical protein n=1 Tax=Zhihengliuella sp. ISTPL4 TaxID=2058657 RepID=UPI000C7A8BCA|nr:hypothetical protein [Zhihengliuella sp. ISTPL4]